MRRLTVALLTLLLLPAPALGAEAFVGVLEDGRVVRFTSEAPFALTTPRTPVGLAAGERLLALGQGPRGLVAVGSSARLYALDPASGRATPIGAPFERGLRGSRFSLAAASGATSARLLSDVGQDLVVDLQSGAATLGPGLRRAGDGAPVRPAADVGTDGRLVGVQLGPATLLRETTPGSSVMSASALGLPSEPRLDEPTGFQVGSDGRGYVLGVAGGNLRRRQSLLVGLDPVTGAVAGGTRPRIEFFGRRLDTFAALGRVAEDSTAARATVRLPRTLSVRRLLSSGLPLTVTSSEAAQVTASVRLGPRSVGFGFLNRDIPGRFAFGKEIFFGRTDRAALRRSVGRRVRVLIGVNDLKGNRRRLEATARLTR